MDAFPGEILSLIFSNFRVSGDCEAARLVCESWRRAMDSMRVGKTTLRLSMIPPALISLRSFPHKPHDFGGLSWLPQLTERDMLAHKRGDWDFVGLSRSPPSFITESFLENFISAAWDWNALFMKNVISLQFWAKHPTINIDRNLVSCGADLPFVFEHPTLPWNIGILYHKATPAERGRLRAMRDVPDPNEQLREETVRQAPVLLAGVASGARYNAARWKYMSGADTLSINDIVREARLPWNWAIVGERADLTSEIVRANLAIEWPWYRLFIRGFISGRELSRLTMHEPDSYEVRSRSPHTTTALVLKNPNSGWDFRVLSANPNLTVKLLRGFPDADWDWVAASRTLLLPKWAQ